MNNKLSPHFDRSEFACKGRDCCGNTAAVSYELVDKLEQLRAIIGGPLRITSGFRCVKHNNEIVGAKNSQHCLGLAADISLDGRDILDMETACRAIFKFVKVYGWGVHVDVRREPPPSP